MRSKAAVALLVVLALLGGAGLLESEAQQPQTPAVDNAPVIAPPLKPDSIEPQPDPLVAPLSISVRIRGVVVTTPIVTVQVGQLVELTIEGPGKENPAFWTYSEDIPDRSERDSGHWVGLSFPLDVVGRAYLIQVAVNGEEGQPPRVAMKWFVVGGVSPRPPPEPTPVPPGPEPEPTPEPQPTTVTAVVYVYEKDQGGVPSGVMKGLDRLNRERKIIATAVDDDVTDGDGDTPEQYKIPFQAARDSGKLPSLVVMTGATVKQVWHDVTTEQHVMEAAK